MKKEITSKTVKVNYQRSKQQKQPVIEETQDVKGENWLIIERRPGRTFDKVFMSSDLKSKDELIAHRRKAKAEKRAKELVRKKQGSRRSQTNLRGLKQ